MNNRDALEQLLSGVIQALSEKIASGEATAADLNVARQLLKDNGIEVLTSKDPAVMNMLEGLPFDINDLT